MNHATQDIIDTLKGTRTAKGLSQRALSERTGVPQSLISKIESGGTDIRLSSLTELARARSRPQAGPAQGRACGGQCRAQHHPHHCTNAGHQGTQSNSGRSPEPQHRLSRSERTEEAPGGFRTLKDLRDVGNELAALQDLAKRIRGLQHGYRNLATGGRRLSALSRATRDAASIPAEHLQALRESVNAVQSLRNRLAHAPSAQPSPPRPAYRLDDDGKDDDG